MQNATDGDGLAHLVDLIGALRSARTDSSLHATVEQLDAEGHRMLRYEVRARTEQGTFEFDCTGRRPSDKFSYVYSPGESTLVVTEAVGAPQRRNNVFRLPSSPPVLGMLSPLDLPIWGGQYDGARVTEAVAASAGVVRLEFGNRDAPREASQRGHAIIDLELGVVRELDYLGSRFVAGNIRTIPYLRGLWQWPSIGAGRHPRTWSSQGEKPRRRPGPPFGNRGSALACCGCYATLCRTGSCG